ncbi:alginate O-acetyltransferase AlgX-related protein [Agrobacterium tumefaciens]|uniref:alginate O-acetyltransferase AlgX-related protein n=1 Tax=Agrobacterium tumefaciens TaxID=358 RepID=UPI00129A9BC1|nr:hypothetical protein [Agrobacterium tumefaciens]MDX8327396.1 hypothetical protein [Agrobacterium tumefaciens]MRH98139.1 hypothetical protein [Agrobacterium tumefaciens]
MTSPKPLHQMVYEGREGWLFLTGDSNAVVDQITGCYKLPSEFSSIWRTLLDHRAHMASKHGYKYVLAVVPNKECVYHWHLPDGMALSKKRPINAVIKSDSNKLIYYMADAFAAAGPERTFSKVDTHWNSFGSILGFNALMIRLGIEPISADRFVRKEETISGDLGGKIGRTERVSKFLLTSPSGRPIENNTVPNIGSRIVFESGNKSLPRCVIFRDSFTSSQLFLFPERFSRVVYVWQPNLDYSIIEAERPDFVISQQVERFLVEPPDDLGGPTQKENEGRKKALSVN